MQQVSHSEYLYHVTVQETLCACAAHARPRGRDGSFSISMYSVCDVTLPGGDVRGDVMTWPGVLGSTGRPEYCTEVGYTTL